jgi:hypothetical protein
LKNQGQLTAVSGGKTKEPFYNIVQTVILFLTDTGRFNIVNDIILFLFYAEKQARGTVIVTKRFGLKQTSLVLNYFFTFGSNIIL